MTFSKEFFSLLFGDSTYKIYMEFLVKFNNKYIKSLQQG